MTTDTHPQLVVTFSDGTSAGWNEGSFFGDENKVARAIIRCDTYLEIELEDGFVNANSYSVQGAAIALVGGTDFSSVIFGGSETVSLKPSVIASSVGTWH